LNLKIFKTLRKQADNASQLLARERGACPDAAEYGAEERFSHKLAIAPTASISIICGEASPCIEPYSSNAYAQKTLSGRSTIRNRYLADILARHNCNDEETWGRITSRRGSVQNLECLSDAEKSVFRTAYEIDQRWLIDLAADRAPYICQSQSLNLFLRSNIHKRDLHGIHMMAWKRGVKSLYYCRSETLQRGESANLQGEATLGRTQVPLKGTVGANGANGADDKAGEEQKVIDYEECLACQ
ncbi:MAG: ribonucleotide-diphosphate reductase subunit alpha, partial [Alphaproteobacteria bacterium]|nr:ribonucleotide-diphosphate reductase subunit alpha [Alphaproteobacteria bacterium]